MERGLRLFRDGEDALKMEKIRKQKAKEGNLESGDPTQETTNSQATVATPRSAHLFTENPWGVKARRLVQTTAKLDARRWENILSSTSAHINGKDVRFDAADEESGSDTLDDEDDHAMVDLNW